MTKHTGRRNERWRQAGKQSHALRFAGCRRVAERPLSCHDLPCARYPPYRSRDSGPVMADGVVFGSRAAPCCAWQVDDFRRFRDVGRWLSSSTRSQCGRSRREHPPPAGVCSVDATPVEHLVVLQHGLARSWLMTGAGAPPQQRNGVNNFRATRPLEMRPGVWEPDALTHPDAPHPNERDAAP